MPRRGSELSRRRLHVKRSLLPPKQMYADAPPGLRGFLLNRLASAVSRSEPEQLLPGRDLKRYSVEAHRICWELVERSAKGAELERAGQIDEAIRVYEANVADMFDGDRPYDRLRTIYSARKQYDKALRVCRRFIDMVDALTELGSESGNLQQKRQTFVEWCEKLEAKLERQRASLVKVRGKQERPAIIRPGG